MRNLAIILLVLSFVGCRPCKEVSNTIRERDSVMVFRDSTILIPADSSWFKALLECDSANNIHIKQLEMFKGYKVDQNIFFRDRYIYVTAKVDSEKVYLHWKELHTSSNNSQIEVKTEYVKVYPKWLVITAFAGAMLFITVLIYIIIKIKLRK